MLRILGSNALVLFFVCLASGGCATRSPEVAPPETKAEAVAHQQGVIATAATDEDAQVDLLDHQLRLASMAIDAGDTELARNTLVEYTDTLSSIYGEETFQSRADKAISKFTAEEEKYFIGDPYEQMMAYLYLGMLDFQAGDI
ncbi:MAG: hypothetical protein KJ052_17040, partial [Candidatus Hydrogenedentes bacterium]|nr:hypothetical protein [Candidatus Hydrogenedentota bacterium]